jgi:hypothetical protein
VFSVLCMFVIAASCGLSNGCCDAHVVKKNAVDGRFEVVLTERHAC